MFYCEYSNEREKICCVPICIGIDIFFFIKSCFIYDFIIFAPSFTPMMCRKTHRENASHCGDGRCRRYQIQKRRLSCALFSDSSKAQETLKLLSRDLVTDRCPCVCIYAYPYCILIHPQVSVGEICLYIVRCIASAYQRGDLEVTRFDNNG